MIPITFEGASAFSGFCITVAAAVAGIFRFRAWWIDRARQSRLESATYLKEKGKDEWEVQFGTDRLRRIHFASLTGIDRPSGHQALLRCQQKMGGSDRDWDAMRGVGRFLIATGHTARIRKPGKRDLIGCIASAVIAAAVGTLAIWIASVVAAFIEKTPMSAIHLNHILMVLVAGVWCGALSLLSWVLFRYCLQYTNARSLYRELEALGRSQRAQRVHTDSLKAKLELVGASDSAASVEVRPSRSPDVESA